MSRYEQNLTDSSILGSFEYFLHAEVEFYAFCFYEKVIDQIPEAEVEMMFVKFLDNLSEFRESEKNVMMVLEKFCEFLGSNQTEDELPNNIIAELAISLNSFKEKYLKNLRKFGRKKELEVIFKGFCEHFINLDEKNELKDSIPSATINSKMLKRKFSYFKSNDAILIISGNYKNIGKIIYANSKACNMLNYKSDKELIGTCFTELIPPPFNLIHKNILMKFIMFGYNYELKRHHFCIIDKFGYCIEVSMHLKLSFYKENAYFVTKFVRLVPEKSLILTKNDWKICAFSQRSSKFFSEISLNLLDLLPNALDYFDKYQNGVCFKYDQFGKSFLIKKNVLKISDLELFVIYLDTEDACDTFEYYTNLNLDDATNFIQYETVQSQSSKLIFENIERSSIASNTIITNFSLKTTKIFEVSTKALIILIILIFVSNFLLLFLLSQSSSLPKLISEISKIRYFSISCLANIQSLVLISQGQDLLHSSNYYQQALMKNSQNIEEILKEFEKISFPLGKFPKNRLEKKEIEIWFANQNKTFSKRIILKDCIKLVADYSQIIATKDPENFSQCYDEIWFAYRNIPFVYLDFLNETIYEVVNDLTESENLVFRLANYGNNVVAALQVFLVMFFWVFLGLVLKDDMYLWKLIFDVKLETLQSQYSLILRKLSHINHTLYQPRKLERVTETNLRKSHTLIPYLKTSSLILISFFLLIANKYSPISTLPPLLSKTLDQINNNELSKTLSIYSLYLLRNTVNPPYFSSNSNFTLKNLDFLSNSTLHLSLEKLKSTELKLTANIMKDENFFNIFHDFIDFSYASPCNYQVNISNCFTSFISKGVHSALIDFTNEIEFNSYKFDSYDHLKLEKYYEDIDEGLEVRLNLFRYKIKDFIETSFENLKGFMVGFVVLTALGYSFIGCKVVKGIRKGFKEKLLLIRMFNRDNMGW